MRRRHFLAGAAAFAAAPLRAEETAGAVAAAGDRFLIGDQEFHLADILAPSAYSLKDGAVPYFNEATATLQNLLAGASLHIEDVAEKTRWGARVVRVRLAGDEKSLQWRLIEEGAARVAPQTDDLAFIDGLLAAETSARNAKKGLWALQDYQAFDALNAQDAVGAFSLVEGTVLKAQKTKSRFYLNFGEDYRTDFTASAASAFYRRWSKRGVDLAAFGGASVRVRGFVQEINGPSVDLKHPRQIVRI